MLTKNSYGLVLNILTRHNTFERVLGNPKTIIRKEKRIMLQFQTNATNQ